MSAGGNGQITWRELWQTGKLWQFGFLCLGIWLHAADELIIATIVPAVVADIGGLELIGWTFALYEIGAIVAGATTGWIVARSNLKLVMLAAAALFMVGCIISAAAPSMPVMLAGRAVQGLGGGGLISVAFVATERMFPRDAWPKLFAIMSIVWGSSAFIGPLIGGLFATYGLWRWSFWIFAIQAALLFVVVFFLLSVPDTRSDNRDETLPVRRLAVLSGSIILIAAAGIDVELVSSTLFMLAGIAGFIWFLFLDSRQSTGRLLPPQPFNINTTLGAGLLMVLVTTMAAIPFSVYGATLMGTLFGISPLAAGYIIALESVAWSSLGILVASAPQRLETPLVRGGMLLVLIGTVGAMITMPVGPVIILLIWPICLGAGFGMSWPFIVRFVVEAAKDEDRSIAASAVPTIQRVGYAVGASLAGIVANWAGFSEGLTIDAATSVAFWVFAAFVPLAVFGVLASLRLTANLASTDQ